MTALTRSSAMTLRFATAVLLGLAWLPMPARAAAESVDPWTYAYAGLQAFYNAEYPKAIGQIQKAIEADPENPIFYNFLANAYLFEEMYRLGKLEGNLYDASNAFLKEKKKEPDPEQMAKVKDTIAKVREMCETRLEVNPRDVDALYALGTSYGIEGNYKFTIEKSWYQALRAGGKANDLHEKVLKLDPTYQDAKLIPGIYQYVVGSIPASVKWLAFLFGHSGSKERGIRLLQEAMQNGKWVTSDAAFLLSVIYNREKRYDYARQLLIPLSEFYGRNPLIRLEVGRTYLREGNIERALENHVAVAKDMEAGRPGYDKLSRERLWYQIGSLYQRLARWDQALAAYTHIIDHSESDGLMKAYSGLRRGEIFLAQKRPDRARTEYERVAAMPYKEPARQAKERLQALNQ